MKKKDEYNYFDEFVKNAEYIVESVIILNETLNNYNQEDLESNIEKVHKLENAADKTLHHMRSYLIKDFLPPIEREDIILIGHRLDDVEDYIDEILINFKILNVSQVRKDSLEFVNLLIKCCTSLKEALQNFKNLKKVDLIKEKVIEINELEDQGDRLFENSMQTLYRENNNPLDIIKWTTIYNCFENTIDACEKVADSMEDIIMKNS